MKKYYLLSFFFSILLAKSISQLQRCACQEYPAAICTFKPYCTWTGKQCLDLICSSLPQENCNAKLTEYKCIWNEQQNQCKEHQYKCSDLSLKYCSQPYGPDCIANETTQQCVDYNCNDVVDSYYCDPKRCSYINDKCGDPVNQDCSGLETCDGIQFNGDGKICYLNDLGVCKQYNSYPQSCSEFNDSSDLCNNHSCTFDETNSICQPVSCNFIKTESLCNTIEDDINKVRYICSWNEDSCQNAEPEEQIQNYFINNCFDANYLMQIMREPLTRSSIYITRKSIIINYFYDHLYIYFMKIFYLISYYLLKQSQSPRVINVSSIAHTYQDLQLNDVNCDRWANSILWSRYYTYRAYGNTKLALILNSQEFSKRTGIKSCSLHPGVVRSDILKYQLSAKWCNILMTLLWPIFVYFTKDCYYGCQTTLYCIMLNDEEFVDGGFYKDLQLSKPKYTSDGKAKELWDFTFRLIEKIQKNQKKE